MYTYIHSILSKSFYLVSGISLINQNFLNLLCGQSLKSIKQTNEYYFEEDCYITEISNSIDDEALSIARARVEPGAKTKLHCLKEITERYVILSGEGLVEVGSTIAQSVNVGDVVIIPPMCPQKITNTGKR